MGSLPFFVASLLLLYTPVHAYLRVGSEYASVDMKGCEWIGDDIGLTAIKPYAEAIQWGNMVSGPNAVIDYSTSDLFVGRWQHYVPFLLFPLKTNGAQGKGAWGVRDPGRDNRPKPQYEAEYQRWIAGVVERYDGDGHADMPGLMNPVTHYEIGTEFSSYEPEDGAAYVGMLRLAYAAVKQANRTHSVVLHAAFLPLNVFDPLDATTGVLTPINTSNPAALERAWSFATNSNKQDAVHDYAAVCAILDAFDVFDALNFHSLGHVREIDATMAWLDYEITQRPELKDYPVIISDTGINTLLIGPNRPCATAEKWPKSVYPTRRQDKCRFGDYYTHLEEERQPDVVAWARNFVAGDVVKRVSLALSHPTITLINTAFLLDLPSLYCLGSCGHNAFSGLISHVADPLACSGCFKVKDRYPAYFALQRMLKLLGATPSSSQRVLDVRVEVDPPHSVDDDDVYVFVLPQSSVGPLLIGWVESSPLILPPTISPSLAVNVTLPGLCVQGTQSGVSTPLVQLALLPSAKNTTASCIDQRDSRNIGLTTRFDDLFYVILPHSP